MGAAGKEEEEGADDGREEETQRTARGRRQAGKRMEETKMRPQTL